MDRNIGDEILEALKEVHAHVKGEAELNTQTLEYAPPDLRALHGDITTPKTG